ncbi:LOW QUALITY PROTEIN: putative vomeronasal receptor-like protein 4 [Lemur catta]|uniref:LOW QUALITY PROTEIN: putative vomeronasal receptor-like protein 4 n=1 Tax=Lemur catta TaxID=9447 RepID=UPI001E268CDD|nr:LOW QUALITY PROTEIN: putative vomeronasal receptor-like protein 4 [Lemur catta]
MLSLKDAFYFQAGIGLIGNTSLLFFHIFTLILDHRLKFSNLITCLLALIHIILLLIAVFLASPDLFESLNFGSDFKCKAFFYLNRVMRGLSICTTCLLSMLQSITICPSTSWLVRFKKKSTNLILHGFFFQWFLSLSLSSYLVFSTVASSNVTQTNVLTVSKYCSLSSISYIVWSLSVMLPIITDVSFVGIMLLSSTYMVMLLFRHQKHSQYLRTASLSSKDSPEKRATQTILLLVSFFVVMYWVDLSISSSSSLLRAYDPVVLGVQRLVCNVYASVSPLVLLTSNKMIINILQNMQQKWHRFLTRQ